MAVLLGKQRHNSYMVPESLNYRRFEEGGRGSEIPCSHPRGEVNAMLFDEEGVIAEALERTKTLKWATVGLLVEMNTPDGTRDDDGAFLGDVKIILAHFYRLAALFKELKENCEATRVKTPRN